jgi:hypothetical protein
MELHYHCAITTYCDELPLLLNNLLGCRIQLTTCLWPCKLLNRLLRSVSGLGFRVPPLTTQTAYQPLGATPQTRTLPFLVPINWAGLVVKSAPPVTFHRLRLPLRAGKSAFFPQHPASLLAPPVLSVMQPSRVRAGLRK